MHPSTRFMNEAITLAQRAMDLGEYPIGAVVVFQDIIVGAAHTALDSQPDPTAHAEIIALRAAAKHLGTRHLDGAVLYSTLEPCPMCTSAAIWSRCSGLVFGASQEDAAHASNAPSATRRFRQILLKATYVAARGEPHLTVIEHFMRSECNDLLRYVRGR
jgi:tRNA(Arg) A34 adenosine deaminase TadA